MVADASPPSQALLQMIRWSCLPVSVGLSLRANVALQPRRFTIARSADGCKRLLGRPLYSTQLENCGFILLIELDDVVVTASQELCDVFCRAVAEPNPNELRRGPPQEGKSMKILVLADYQAAVLTRQVPDGRICRPALTQSSNV